MIEAARKAGNLAKGGRPLKTGLRENPVNAPTLADMGVDKNLADRARKAAEMSETKFEKHVAQAVRGAVAAAEGNKEIIAEARATQQDEKRQHRERREETSAPRFPPPSRAVRFTATLSTLGLVDLAINARP
jgi:hypothetical protein